MEAKYQFQNQKEQLEIIVNSNKKLKEVNEHLKLEKSNSINKYYIVLLSILSIAIILYIRQKRK